MSRDPLDRLLRSAARCPRTETSCLPPGFERTLLAALSRPEDEPNPWISLRPVFRWALLASLASLVAACGLGFLEMQDERLQDMSMDSTVLSNSAVTLALLR